MSSVRPAEQIVEIDFIPRPRRQNESEASYLFYLNGNARLLSYLFESHPTGKVFGNISLTGDDNTRFTIETDGGKTVNVKVNGTCIRYKPKAKSAAVAITAAAAAAPRAEGTTTTQSTPDTTVWKYAVECGFINEGAHGSVFRSRYSINQAGYIKLKNTNRIYKLFSEVGDVKLGYDTNYKLVKVNEVTHEHAMLSHIPDSHVKDPIMLSDNRAVLISREYAGVDLLTICARFRFNINIALRFTVCFMEAIARFHTTGMIHRDVKLGNTIADVYVEGNVVVGVESMHLADFGSAIIPGMVSFGIACGTPEHTAPEEWESRPISQKVDAYSAGISLMGFWGGLKFFDDNYPERKISREAYLAKLREHSVAGVRPTPTQIFGSTELYDRRTNRLFTDIHTIITELTQPDTEKRISVFTGRNRLREIENRWKFEEDRARERQDKGLVSTVKRWFS